MKPIRVQLMPCWHPRPRDWLLPVGILAISTCLVWWVRAQHASRQAQAAALQAQVHQTSVATNAQVQQSLKYQPHWNREVEESQADWLAALRALDRVARPGVTPQSLSFSLTERRIVLELTTSEPPLLWDYLYQLNAGLSGDLEPQWEWQPDQWNWHAADASYTAKLSGTWQSGKSRPVNK